MSIVSVLSNRTFAALLSANTIFAAAFPIQLIVGALAGVMIAPNAAMATLPSSVQTLAALVAAAPISLLMGRAGRRAGFVFGAALTLAGALAAVQALFAQNFVVLCFAHFLMGAGWSGFQYFRFAASEAAQPEWRPVAISLMLTSGLVAAIVGPQVFIAAKDALAPIPFAGAYAATGAIAVLGVIPLAAVSLPPPPRMPRARGTSRLASLTALRRPLVQRAVGIAAISQGVMAFLMIPTPIAMVTCGFTETAASDVVRWHIVAMFAPSFATGFLIKRFGAQRVAVTGLFIIAGAAFIAFLGISAGHFYAALITLGLGWNFGFVGATTMLDAAVGDAEKAAVQGVNDTAIALVTTICAFASGFVVSMLGWAALALVSIGLVAFALMMLATDRVRIREV